MVADWWSHRLAGDTTTMTAFRRDDVDDLNGRARAYLERAAQLYGPVLEINDRPFQAGDQIVCLRNNRRLGIHNGTRAEILDVDPDQRTLTIRMPSRDVQLPASYLDAGHIAHGYATTIHKTQGATVDRGLLLGTDELFRERGYVGMSRGRLSNHLYLLGATPADDPTGHGPPAPTIEPTDAVRQALHHQSEQRLAIDTGQPIDPWPLEQLVTERHRLVGVLAACPPDRSHDIKALAARRHEAKQELEPLIARRNELVDRKLKLPSVRREIRGLCEQVGALSEGLGRLDAELENARRDAASRKQFQNDHAPDTARLDTIEQQLDHHLQIAARQIAQRPTSYHLHILGNVPEDPDHRATWLRGAAHLERHRLGLDDHGHPDLSTPRSRTSRAEALARLEVLAIPRNPEPVQRALESDHGLDLFG